MTTEALLTELNRDIWQPFMAAYRAGDLAGFLAVHSPELVRAGGPVKEVYGYDTYAAQMAEFFGVVAERGDQLSIDFRFTERIAAGDLASERGIYEITIVLASGEQRPPVHGQFHTYARKADGRWRITVDYDATTLDDATPVTAAQFAAAAAPDDLTRFVQPAPAEPTATQAS